MGGDRGRSEVGAGPSRRRCDCSGRRHPPGSEDSIIERVKARPSYFFGIILTVSAAGAVVAIGGNDNTGVLDVATQILNGILMIPIVGVLWYLTAFHLPECPLVGVRKWVTGISFFVCCVFSVVGLLTQGGSSRM